MGLFYATGDTALTHSQPPITGTTHTLPFDRLSPRDFERLCLWLVEREEPALSLSQGYERAEHLGAVGSEQGRDIIAWRESQLWAFQCKGCRGGWSDQKPSQRRQRHSVGKR